MKRTIFFLLIAGMTAASVTAADPLTLSQQECRTLALQNSEEMQKAANRISSAELDTKTAKGAMLPTVDGMMSSNMIGLPRLTYDESNLMVRGYILAGFNPAISIVQPIYAGGQINTTKQLAAVGEKAAREQQRLTHAQVVTESDRNYWTYIAVLSKVKMLRSYQALLDTAYHQTQTAVVAGMATQNDLLRIEARRSEINYQMQRAQNGADLCRMSLCRIIGVSSDTPIGPADTLIEVESPETLEAGTATRPELKLLQAQVDADRLGVRLARGAQLPTVGLSLGYTMITNLHIKSSFDIGYGIRFTPEQRLHNDIAIAMLAVKIPIAHGGAARNKVHKAQLTLQNAQLDLQKNSRLLDLEAQQAVRNLHDGYRMIGTAKVALSQAEENLRVIRNRQAASMAPLTDLLDAQSQWEKSYSNLIEAQTQYKISQTEYLRTTGQLN